MTTYVAFDGDKDMWAYGYMRGWSANKRIDFELLDAHDLDNMTARAQGEYYVKGKLRERMNKSTAFVRLVGESTKHLHKYVGWEIDLALEMGLPIVVVNQGYDAIGWYGLGAPKDTPAAIIDKLNNEINAILADPTMKARLFALGAEPMPMTSAAFGKFMSDEADKWGKVIKFAGIKPD
jgi:hypothetical protein